MHYDLEINVHSLPRDMAMSILKWSLLTEIFFYIPLYSEIVLFQKLVRLFFAQTSCYVSAIVISLGSFPQPKFVKCIYEFGLR